MVGVILPLGMGRRLVRCIIASISLSTYDVSVSQPALAAVIATVATISNSGVRGRRVCFHAMIIVAKEVKTSRKTIGGFVTST